MKNYKNFAVLSALGLVLSGCSLMERTIEEEPEVPAGSTRSAEGEISPQKTDYLEKELSRINAKVEALETKVEVLTSNFEKQQLRGTQPVVSAEPFQQAPASAAIGETVSSTSLGGGTNSTSLSSVEGEFRGAMEMFQSGKNLEAGVAFTNFARRNSSHHLAAHALYWAGESNARAEQWRLAVSSWEELQKKYPHSAYMPEALAGLARAYSSMGNPGLANESRAILLRSFPQAPAALSLQSTNPTPTSPMVAESISDEVPAEERSALNKEEIEAPFKEQPIEDSSEE